MSGYGILCATPEELAALRERLHLDARPEVHGRTRVWRGTHDGEALVLAQMGIGKVNAAAATTLLLSLFECRALICSGVAGGLSPDLPVGAVLLADKLAIHDYGLVAGGRFTATASGQIPIEAPELVALAPVRPQVAEALAQLAAKVAGTLGHPVRCGGIITADYFLNCGETRDELRTRFGAEAIDMESGAIHQVADAWERPLYVIRTLSDLAGEESHVTYGQMALMAAQNSALCVAELLAILKAAPSSFPSLETVAGRPLPMTLPIAVADQLRGLLGHAHAPYSGVHVSAVVEAPDGSLYGGVNVENAAYPQGVCAEASAISAAVTAGQTRLVQVFVSSNLPQPIWPCGGCRQKIFEFAEAGCEVVTVTPDGRTDSRTIEELLPLGFRLQPKPVK